MILRFLAPLFSVLLFVAATEGRANPIDPAIPDIALGQVWSIKSAAPSSAKIIISGIEPWHGKTVVQISVVDVPIPQGLGGGTTTIGHMPFDKSAVVVSVDQLLATDARPPPQFEAGYGEWRAANGGVYTVSVDQAIQLLFETLSRGHK
jgi:hypothetical protein